MNRLATPEATNYSELHSPLIGMIRDLAATNGLLPRDALTNYDQYNTLYDCEPVPEFIDFLEDELSIARYVMTPLPLVRIHPISIDTSILTAHKPKSDTVTAIYSRHNSSTNPDFSAMVEQNMSKKILHVTKISGSECQPYLEHRNHPLIERDVKELTVQLRPLLLGAMYKNRVA
ncbi:hypothetical protein KC955_02560 [Candidatus Saccharibacteria bacterium]|nr:hypothetical protein [Candidatus Saccharibacteria bacterium]